MADDTPRLDSPLRATLAGIRDRFARTGSRSLGPDERLDGKVVLLTGANRGLGTGIAERLARLGATLIVACRSDAEATAADLRATTGNAKVTALSVDLSDPTSVAGVVQALVDRDLRLDRAVLNAGVVPLASRQTASGLDLMFHVNFLANVDLVEGLLEHDRFAPGARLVVVSSEAHRSGEADLAHFGEPATYGTGGVMAHYGTSKLYLTAYAHALSAALPADELGVFAVCPGAVDSEIAREAPGWMKVLLKPTMRLLFQSPLQASEPVVWLCAAHELEGQTGRYHHMHAHKPAAPFATEPATRDAVRTAARKLLQEIR